MNCPHCGSTSILHCYKPINALSIESYYRCKNIACGHTFMAALEIVATIHPSANPNQKIAKALRRSERMLRLEAGSQGSLLRATGQTGDE